VSQSVEQPEASKARSGNSAEQGLDSLRSEIEREIGEIVQAGDRPKLVDRVSSLILRESFRGPLPPPRHFREYEDVFPGAAARILAMAEKEQNSNIELSQLALSPEISERRLGLWQGFGAFALLTVGAFGCALVEQPILGGAFLAVGAISAVRKFIDGRKDQDEKS